MSTRQNVTVESYNQTAEDYAKNVCELHPKKASTVFTSFLRKGSKVLDIGCGSGRDAQVFVEKGYQVVGIDLSSAMIGIAKKKVKKARFQIMDMRNLIFNDNTFDGIWANAVLLHVPKKKISSTLKEWRRVLKKSGLLYIGVKEGRGEGFEMDKRYKTPVKKYFSYFEKSEIERKVKLAGFTVDKLFVEKEDHEYSHHPWIRIFSKKR